MSQLADELTDALRDLAPTGVSVGALPVDDAHVGALHDVERRSVELAAPVRRREFATGRVLLRSLVGEPVCIPVGASRAPELPHGLRGSLAHDSEVAVAAVAPASVTDALGIDVEPIGGLGVDEADTVLRPDERDLDVTMAFVLKEATYKAWSTSGGGALGFGDVRLAVGGDAFVALVGPDEIRLHGRIVRAGGRWLALVVR